MKRNIIVSLVVLACWLGAEKFGYSQPYYTYTTTNTPVAVLVAAPQLPQAVVTNMVPSNTKSYVTTNPPYIFVKRNAHVGAVSEGTRMFLDGKDVTDFAVIGADSASYSPPGPLALGDHTVMLEGRNFSGQQFRQLLGFTVQPAGPSVDLTGSLLIPTAIGAIAPQALETVSVQSVTTTPGEVMGAPSYDTMTVTTTTHAVPLVPRNLYLSSLASIKILDSLSEPARHNDRVPIVLLGRPNGVATFDLVQRSASGDTIMASGLPMEQVSPGTYQAIYRVGDTDAFNSAVLVGHLSLPDGQMLTSSTATINDRAFYAMYVSSPLYATVWIPDIAAIGR